MRVRAKTSGFPSLSMGRQVSVFALLIVLSGALLVDRISAETETGGNSEIATKIEADWNQVAALLVSPEYTVRETAFEQLIDAGEPAFEAVCKAAQGDGEACSRAVAILESWAFAPESEFAERCEQALMDLSGSMHPPGASIAATSLNLARDVRQYRAVTALESHLAGIWFSPSPNTNSRQATFPALGPDFVQPPVEDGGGNPLDRIDLIGIFPTWKGGTDGLWHLKRLKHQAGLHIRVANRELPDAEVTKATSVLESARVDFVGASLGLSGNTSSPLIVERVIPGKAADRAGLRSGDIILEFDGQEVSQIADLILLLRNYNQGDQKELKYQRYGPLGLETHSIEVTLQGWEEMPIPGNEFRRQKAILEQQKRMHNLMFPR